MKGAGTVRSPERPVASIAEVTDLVEATPKRYRAALLTQKGAGYESPSLRLQLPAWVVVSGAQNPWTGINGASTGRDRVSVGASGR